MSLNLAALLLLHASPAFARSPSQHTSMRARGYLYCTYFDDDHIPNVARIYQYRIEQNGTLSSLSPPYVEAGSNEVSMVAGRYGRILYVGSDAGIHIYKISANGSLQPHPKFTKWQGVEGGFVLSPSGKFLYFVSHNRLMVCHINRNGALKPLPNESLPLDPTYDTSGLDFDQSNHYAFLLRFNGMSLDGSEDEFIQQFDVSPSGSLMPNVQPYAVNPETSDKWFNLEHGLYPLPHQQVFYLAGNCGDPGPDLITFKMTPFGVLQKVSEWSETDPAVKDFNDLSHLIVEADPLERYLYMYYVNCLLVSRIGKDGVLLPPLTEWAYSDGTIKPSPYIPSEKYGEIDDLAFDPSGNYAYACCFHDGLLGYKIGSDGRLTRLGPPRIGPGRWAQGIVIVPQ